MTGRGWRVRSATYAAQAEGYPDLVVYGPLLALLALEFPRIHAPERVVRSFRYRLVRPAFLPARVISTGRPASSSAEITVGAEGAEPPLTASAGLERKVSSSC
jgi:3-methylfumaryl-CoA hydratase